MASDWDRQLFIYYLVYDWTIEDKLELAWFDPIRDVII